jgi:ubiquinone/menaquinone biosynthesis C-methylase UbiE
MSSDVHTDYLIHESPVETHREAVLAGVMSDASARLFREIGVAEGWNCLDVGSGGGQVALALGGLVGRSGSVTGVDVGEGAVHTATTAARESGSENVEFEPGDVYALPFKERFDLAYARLLLVYLTEPVAAIRAMAAAVRPGGVVAVEDIFSDDLRSEPETPALADLRRIYGATVRAHGGDPTIGPRLAAMFHAAGLEDVKTGSVVNVMTTSEEKSFLVELVDSMHDAIIETGSATESEVAEMRGAVQAAADDPSCTFYQARIYQVFGTRPAT